MTKNPAPRSTEFTPARSDHHLLLLAGLLGATGVALGAFGAHALKDRLLATGRLSTWETAVVYQLIHAVSILGIALHSSESAPRNRRWLTRAGFSWALGVVFFSGSLYGLALQGPVWLGPITPLGGVALIIGWIFVIVAAKSGRAPAQP